MSLGYVDMSAEELIAKVGNWQFSPLDNMIWHYARIQLLKELLFAGK